MEAAITSGERKVVHVVSNSHCDREWGYPFEETRLLLLEFMDGLLNLLDNDKGNMGTLPILNDITEITSE